MGGMKKNSAFLDVVVSIGANPTFKVIFTPLEYIPTIPPLSSYVINICLYLTRRLHFSLEKYTTNIDDVLFKRRNLEPKKWSLFDKVGLYSSGVKMTLKV